MERGTLRGDPYTKPSPLLFALMLQLNWILYMALAFYCDNVVASNRGDLDLGIFYSLKNSGVLENISKKDSWNKNKKFRERSQKVLKIIKTYYNFNNNNKKNKIEKKFIAMIYCKN